MTVFDFSHSHHYHYPLPNPKAALLLLLLLHGFLQKHSPAVLEVVVVVVVHEVVVGEAREASIEVQLDGTSRVERRANRVDDDGR